MSKKKRIFRDAETGRFASKETKNRSQAQGGDTILEEKVDAEKIDAGIVIDDVNDIFEYEDYEEYDYDEWEFHGTGDTGKRE